MRSSSSIFVVAGAVIVGLAATSAVAGDRHYSAYRPYAGGYAHGYEHAYGGAAHQGRVAHVQTQSWSGGGSYAGGYDGLGYGRGSGWRAAPISAPHGYPVHGLGRGYHVAPAAVHHQSYSAAPVHVETYSAHDRGGRYGYSHGYRGCGPCGVSHAPSYSYAPAPVRVTAPPVHVAAPPVHVSAAPVYVDSAPIYVDQSPVYVQSAPVRVQAPPVYVSPAQVHVAPPQVEVLPSPVHVAPAQVHQAPAYIDSQPLPPPPAPPHHHHHHHGDQTAYPYQQERGERG